MYMCSFKNAWRHLRLLLEDEIWEKQSSYIPMQNKEMHYIVRRYTLTQLWIQTYKHTNNVKYWEASTDGVETQGGQHKCRASL